MTKLNKTIIGQEIEVLEKIENYNGYPWHVYKIRAVESGKVRIVGAKYLENEFWAK